MGTFLVVSEVTTKRISVSQKVFPKPLNARDTGDITNKNVCKYRKGKHKKHGVKKCAYVTYKLKTMGRVINSFDNSKELSGGDIACLPPTNYSG